MTIPTEPLPYFVTDGKLLVIGYGPMAASAIPSECIHRKSMDLPILRRDYIDPILAITEWQAAGVPLPKRVTCHKCAGAVRLPQECDICHATELYSGITHRFYDCPACEDSGKLHNDCELCFGAGVIIWRGEDIVSEYTWQRVLGLVVNVGYLSHLTAAEFAVIPLPRDQQGLAWKLGGERGLIMPITIPADDVRPWSA